MAGCLVREVAGATIEDLIRRGTVNVGGAVGISFQFRESVFLLLMWRKSLEIQMNFSQSEEVNIIVLYGLS